MQAKTFSDLVTFSRSTAARYFNSAGLMVQAAVNEPRFEYNPATLAPLGLKMEPARTNSLTFSQDFSNAAWTKSRLTATVSGLAPDGTSTAYKLTVSDATGISALGRSTVTWVSGQSYSLSKYVKADTSTTLSLHLSAAGFGTEQRVNFDLAGDGSFVVATGTPTAMIAKLANGWFLCVVIATATASATATAVTLRLAQTLNASIFVWGAQLEVGAWHSSYIPTTTAAATRAVDQAFLASLSPWFNATEGTLYSEVVSTYGPAFHASLGTTAPAGPRLASQRTSTAAGFQVVDDSSALVYSQQFPGVTNTQIMKQAISFKADDFQSAFNGSVGAPDLSGSLPTPTRLTLGARGVSTDAISGHIRKIKFYPYRLSAAELQAMTT